MTCGDGGADNGIDVERVADDRRIADSSRELPGDAAGTARAGEGVVGVDAEDADGVVILIGDAFFDVGGLSGNAPRP